ncbi:hypothetical protein J6590_017196 [Homalodisca vitripennis]|nr:hypothetical protein J6590_017196 [Homalodisca vitripennis]
MTSSTEPPPLVLSDMEKLLGAWSRYYLLVFLAQSGLSGDIYYTALIYYRALDVSLCGCGSMSGYDCSLTMFK